MTDKDKSLRDAAAADDGYPDYQVTFTGPLLEAENPTGGPHTFTFLAPAGRVKVELSRNDPGDTVPNLIVRFSSEP